MPLPSSFWPKIYYRRTQGGSVFARDRQGHSAAFTFTGNGVQLTGSGAWALPPVYGRPDFGNRVRFNGSVRSEQELAQAWHAAGGARVLSSDWLELPRTRSQRRRPANQGMTGVIQQITGPGGPATATGYSQWYAAQARGLTQSVRDALTNNAFEWCHLIAHSMNGGAGPGNVVAAVRGNNTEQLAIESALQMYRSEGLFHVRVQALLLDALNGCHLADSIRYSVRSAGEDFAVRPRFTHHLDCLYAPRPSAIHFYSVLEGFVSWANGELRAYYWGSVTADEARQIRNYLRIRGHASDTDLPDAKRRKTS